MLSLDGITSLRNLSYSFTLSVCALPLIEEEGRWSWIIVLMRLGILIIFGPLGSRFFSGFRG